MADCFTCELIKRRDAGGAPVWDAIERTPYWDLVHAYDTSLLGWLVLVLRRHAAGLAELTDEEAAELGPLVQRVSRALVAVTGCAKTYVVQFAEHPQHPHVHVHVVARYPDETALGPRIFERLGVPIERQVGEPEMSELALRLRDVEEEIA